MRKGKKQTWRKHIIVLMRRTNILSTFSLRNATLEENNSSVNGSDSFAMVAVVKMAWSRVSKFWELELCLNYSSGNSIIEEVDLTRKPWRILTSAWNVLHSGIYHKRWENRIESDNKIVSFHVPFAIVVLSPVCTAMNRSSGNKMAPIMSPVFPLSSLLPLFVIPRVKPLPEMED